MKPLIIKFRNAARGIKLVFKESSFVIQFIIGAAVIFLMFYFPLSRAERAVLFVTIFLVLGFEIINSAIEKSMDCLAPETDEKVKAVKDLAAGAVLIFAIGAIIIGVTIFLPHILSFLK